MKFVNFARVAAVGVFVACGVFAAPTAVAAPQNGEADTFSSMMEQRIGSTYRDEDVHASLHWNVDAVRKLHKLKPLKVSDRLSGLATRHSKYQAKNRRVEYSGAARMEAVSRMFPEYHNTTKDVFTDWLWHPTTRARLLDPNITEYGIGFGYDDKAGYWYFTWLAQ